MYPSTLILEQRQKDVIERWVHKLNVKYLLVEEDEDAVVTSPLTFEVYATGLGDVVHVKYRVWTLGISIGDDNELYVTGFGEAEGN